MTTAYKTNVRVSRSGALCFGSTEMTLTLDDNLLLLSRRNSDTPDYRLYLTDFGVRKGKGQTIVVDSDLATLDLRFPDTTQAQLFFTSM